MEEDEGCLEGTFYLPNPYRQRIEAIEKLHQDACEHFPDHLRQKNPARHFSEDEFDVNEYFSVLKHISLPDDLVLDYAYMNDANGRPYLYVRRKEDEPFKTYGEYRSFLGWDQIEDMKKSDPNNINNTREKVAALRKQAGRRKWEYLESIMTDDTEEGFLELAFFRVLAGQFYLRWHCYTDLQVVVDKNDIARVIDEWIRYESPPFTRKQKREANKIDPEPIILMADDTVRVSIVTFSQWGGFRRLSFHFQRTYPHILVKREIEILVDYDCGIFM